MPSSATTRNRLEKQGTGENSGTWGTELNAALDRIDESLDGVEAFTLSGSKTLTSTNYDDDEARERILKITGGTGGTITIPAVEKWYLVVNGASGDVILTTGSGTTATVKSGNALPVVCDGTDCAICVVVDYGTTVPKCASVPTTGSHLVNKTYADGLAFSSSLPGQSGNSGKFLTTDGSTASWAAIAYSDVSGLSTNYMALTGAQTAAGLKTFSNGISINGNTLDGLTAAGVTLIEAADAAAQRTALGITGSDWVEIDNQTATGATIVFEDLTSYNDLALVVRAVSHNSGSSQTLIIEHGEVNGSFGADHTLGPSIAAAGIWYGMVSVTKPPGGGALVTGAVSDSGAEGSVTPLVTYRNANLATIRLKPSGGASFDSGSFILYGR